jgi:hypothetical protein
MSHAKAQRAPTQAVFGVLSRGPLEVSREMFQEISRKYNTPVPANAKLSEEQVKKIRRRVRAGARLTDLAAEYDVNRKTIRRRLDALERAEGERAQQRAARRAEQKRWKRLLGADYRNPARAPEHRRATRQQRSDPRPASELPRSRQASSARVGVGGVPIFPNTREGQLERLAYYEARKLDNLNSFLDFNDVRRGWETPAERRAREARTTGCGR